MPISHPAEAPQRVSRRHRRQPMSAINVTPFVDVMLVLLIVFMVTAPLLTVGVSVDLPKTTSSPLPGQDEPLSVTVDHDGKVYLQDSLLSVDELGPRLRAISERKPDARVFVRGDKVIDYGRVMQVVGAIHAAGFSKVALVTEFDEKAH
ncbi:MAG TPA: protein TolR [Geminicoccaceae bacterium]|jgi:biopolymer transport protein TolR|nr:protein TolR [Geminicoccaceae bacterium]